VVPVLGDDYLEIAVIFEHEIEIIGYLGF